MKKIFLTSLLAMTGIISQAQTNVLSGTLTYQSETTGVKEYAKGVGVFMSRPEVKTDKKSKKTTAAWHMTNMEWIKDYCEAKDVAIEKDYLKLFPAILGPTYIKDLKAVIKKPIMAVGGVNADNLSDFLKVCCGAGIGSAIYKTGKTIAEVDASAKALLKAIGR